MAMGNPTKSALMGIVFAAGALLALLGSGGVNAQSHPDLEQQEISVIVQKAKEGDTKAIELLKRKSSEGNLEASYMLGLMYEKGEGVKRDAQEASRLYQKTIGEGTELLIRQIESRKADGTQTH